MPINLPLHEMSVPDKLAALEAIWDSLAANPADVVSPDWHEHVLAERTQRLASGEATISDWAIARKRLQNLGQ